MADCLGGADPFLAGVQRNCASLLPQGTLAKEDIEYCLQVRCATLGVASYQQANKEYLACIYKKGFSNELLTCVNNVTEAVVAGGSRAVRIAPFTGHGVNSHTQRAGCGCGSSSNQPRTVFRKSRF